MSDLFKVGIFFILILIAFDAIADSAKVRKIIKQKKLILINAGKDDGLKKGEKVCFYKKPKAKKKVACGKVKRLKPTKALVKVKKPKKIKKGFTAKYNIKRKRKAPKEPKKQHPSEPAIMAPQQDLVVEPSRDYENVSSSFDFAARGLWLPYIAPLTPASYNLLTYDGAHTTQGGSLWKSEGLYSEGQNSSIFLSFGGELELKDIGIRFGIHYKAYQTYAAESDYDISQPNLYLFSSLIADALGFYADYAFYFSEFSVGLGVDIDSTTLTLVATRFDDNGVEPIEDIYGIEGSTNILSLRVPVRWDPYFDPVGLSMGLNFMIPLTALGTQVTVVHADTTNGSKVLSVEDDAIEALNLGTGSIALEFVIGAFIGF